MDPSKEPLAVHRAAAANLFSLFNALQLEGFTSQQALVIVGQTLAAAFANPSKDDE